MQELKMNFYLYLLYSFVDSNFMNIFKGESVTFVFFIYEIEKLW